VAATAAPAVVIHSRPNSDGAETPAAAGGVQPGEWRRTVVPHGKKTNTVSCWSRREWRSAT